MSKVALITGANGITGSAIAEYLATKTSSKEWSRIIITSRSPLQLPLQDERLEFVAVDFSKSVDEIAEAFKPFAGSITHAFFSSYVHRDDFSELNSANQALFENFLSGLVKHANKLENVTLQTGGKYYNVHLMPVPSPAMEDDKRLVDFEANFYYPQEDFLKATAKERSFSWNIIRPEAIIGTTYKPNGMNEALTIAMYFMVCKELDMEAAMPTNQRYWEGAEDVSSAASIADLTIYTAVNKDCDNQAFNHTNGDYFTWKYMWPRLAEHFGARASSQQTFSKPYPKEGDLQLERSFYEWSHDKEAVWHKICDRLGCPQAKDTWKYGTWQFQDWVFQRTWSATLSINKARSYGWTKHVDSYTNFIDTFHTFVKAGLIPDAGAKTV